MKKTLLVLLSGMMLLSFSFNVQAQDKNDKEDKSPLNSATFSGFKVRNIGPAMKSGRIADIAIHPEKLENTQFNMQESLIMLWERIWNEDVERLFSDRSK